VPTAQGTFPRLCSISSRHRQRCDALAYRTAVWLEGYCEKEAEGQSIEQHLKKFALPDALELGMCLEGVDLAEKHGGQGQYQNEANFPNELIFLYR